MCGQMGSPSRSQERARAKVSSLHWGEQRETTLQSPSEASPISNIHVYLRYRRYRR